MKNIFSKTIKAMGKATNRATLIFCRKYVAVDITPTEVRALCVRRNTVEKWLSAPVREGLIKDGIILDPQELSLVLENLFTSLSLPRNRVICTITGLPFTYRTIAMPDTGAPITREAIERAARKEMSINEPDMFIYWKRVERRLEQKEIVYFVIAVPKVAIRPLAKALEKTRIKMYEMDLKPLALVRLISAQSAMLLSLENNYIDIAIVDNGLIKTLYSFPLVDTKGDNNRIAGEVISGLDKTLKSYNHDYPDSQLPAETPLLAVGGLTTNVELLKRLFEISGHAMTSFESPFAFPADFLSSVYAANLGLVLRKSPLNPDVTAVRTAQYQDININLLSSLLGTRKPIKPAQAAAALAILAVLVLTYYAVDLRADAGLRLSNLNIEKASTAAKLLTAQKTNRDYLAAQAAGAEKLQKIKAEYDAVIGTQQFISSARINCAGDIKMIIAALPEVADYQNISISNSGIQVNGRAEVPEDVLQMADQLELESQVSMARVVSIQPAEQSVTFNLVIQKK